MIRKFPGVCFWDSSRVCLEIWIIFLILCQYIYLLCTFAAAAAAKSLQLCPTLCNPIDGSTPGSAVPGILQARTLEWVAISFSNAWKWKVKVKSQLCLTLSDPMDCSLPGSSVRGISQARVLEWGVIAFSVCTFGNCVIFEFFKTAKGHTILLTVNKREKIHTKHTLHIGRYRHKYGYRNGFYSHV